MRKTSVLATGIFLSATLSAYAVTIIPPNPKLTGPELTQNDLNLPVNNKKEDVFIEADELAYDSENEIVTASGKVEILKGDNVLFADTVSYNKKTAEVTASGNVVVVGEEGNAMFTDSFTLKDDFKGGVVNFFRTRLSDGSLLAAAQARRIDGNKIILRKAVYSPCKICTENPNSDPQWQLKASEVTLDDVEQTVSYDDATLEVYGLPVFYTPYFSHPTPNADRKSGFLMPSAGTDSNLGVTASTPYYWSIAPNADVTVKPVVTTKEGLVAGGELRHLTEYGEYKFDGSITYAHTYDDESQRSDKRDWRGHLFGEGKFDVSENWDFGFDAKVTSDDTYLRRYNYGSEDLLTSRAYFERIQDRNYSVVQSVYFQGLLEQDNSQVTPYALPYFKNHFETGKGIIPGLDGSKLYGNITGFAIDRQMGEESQRLSINSGVSVPFTTPGGVLIDLDANVRGDQYFIEKSPSDPKENRVIPEASVTWRYPLINQISKSGKLLIEPIAKFVVSPNKNYNRNIPNEDSQDVEFSDLNVFDNNHFRGIDRVETGSRIYYGLRGGYYEDDFSISYVLGQNYRFDESRSLPPVNSGLEGNASDYVGRISASLYNLVDVSYKFRYDPADLAPRRNEVDVTVDYDPVKMQLTYFNLDYDFTNPTDDREEINGLAYVRVYDEWSVMLGGTRNLAENQNIEARTGLLYEGECTNVLATIKRDFISDRDAKSGTSFGIQIGLKNMGEL